MTTEQLLEKHTAAFSEHRERQPSASRAKVAYVMSRFPKLTETFILYEILALEQQGVQVELYPLLRARATVVHAEGASLWKKLIERVSKPQGTVVMHPEATPLVERAHFQPFLSRRILRAHLHFLRRKPQAYLGTLWTLLRANWGSPNFFVGALGIFPKTVYFASLMETDGITHVHAHFANHPAAAAFIIHRLAGIPYSFTAHGADLQVDQHMLREKVAEAAFVVTISNHNKELIVTTCGDEFRDKLVVIHCGVDTQVFQPRGADHHRARLPGPFTILCIGTMYEVKGHTYLIEACRLLKERGVNFVCRLVGDGPDRPRLVEQVAQAGLAAQMHFDGTRTRRQVAELLQQADVLSVPSIPTTSGRREGIPVVLMEAMASGVPVVASGISGIPELVDDGQSGLLVPPRDAVALADALKRLHDDLGLRRRLGQGGRDTVTRKFDLTTNAAALAQRFTAEVGS
ncbi:MAG: glycosyltransferase [Ardenticatenaceae bacterium]|nr:glycosyltransferase [Ardenticatenaceae bacterium]